MRTKDTTLKLTSPARQQGESMEQCRARRKKEKHIVRLFLRGYKIKPKVKSRTGRAK